MAQVQELFVYKRLSAASTTLFGRNTGGALSGFLCTTAGTLQITDADSADIVSSLSLTAGQFVNFPCTCPNGATVALGGGCVGTIFYTP